MKESIYKVLEFHKIYKQFWNDKLEAVIPDQLKDLRQNILQEEVDELKEAQKNNDIVEIADALGDILYIAFGTACTYGLQDHLEEVFNEIHRSNLSKLDENNEPIFREDGKVLKGPNYFRPNIKQILENPKI